MRLCIGSIKLPRATMKAAVGATLVAQSLLTLTPAKAVDSVADTPPAQHGASVADAETSEGGSALAEVVVTARRTQESAQRVPVTMQTFTPEELKKDNITSPFDMARFSGIGGIVGEGDFVNSNGAGQKPSARLRGSPNITQYFNDVPVPIIDNMPGLFFDLASADVLKGPQGTLFGLASSAGSILLTPAKPQNGFSGYFVAGGGERDHHEMEGVINVPVVGDKLIVRMGAREDHAGGYVLALNSGTYMDSRDSKSSRISILARPTDGLENTTVVQYGESFSTGPAYVLYEFNPTGAAANRFGAAAVNSFAEQLATGPYVIQNDGAQGSDGPSWQSRDLFANDVLTWDVNETLTLKNNFSFRRAQVYQRVANGGVTEVPYGNNIAYYSNGQIVPPIVPPPTHNWFEELQASGDLFDKRLSYVGGATSYWSPAPGQANQPLYAASFFATTPNATIASNQRFDNRTSGVYGHAILDLGFVTDGLKFSMGYRHSWIYAKLTERQFDTNPDPTLLAEASYDHHWAENNYLVGLTYQLSRDTMLFLTNSTGYGAPSFNAGFGIPDAYRRYDPEKLDNIEGGIKSTFGARDWIIRANLTGYYGIYSGYQTSVDVNYTNTVSGLPVQAFLIRNSARAVFPGSEAEIRAVTPNEAFDFGGTLLYSDGHFTKNFDAAGNDLTDTPITGLSKWQGTADVNYHLPVSHAYGGISLNVNWTWNTRLSLAKFPTDYSAIAPSFSLLGAVASWNNVLSQPGLSADVGVTNITNRVRSNTVNSIYGSYGYNSFNPVEPRTITGRVRYEF
jgi:iron complex outermembrane recepter protein